MANKATRSLTDEEFTEIISAIKSGIGTHRSNPRVALMLQVEATTLLRISDILTLKVSSFVKSGTNYRLDIVEQKTQKPRRYEVPAAVVAALKDYALEKGLGRNDFLFISESIETIDQLRNAERAVNKYLQGICKDLTTPEHSYECIGTHSFRKYGATRIFNENGYNLELVSRCLQHSSVAITKKYIGIAEDEINAALLANVCMV